jgi:hypothetical protein
VRLSPQFEKALIYATRIHGGKLRKKTRIPYIGHILGVTAIALEYGANETEAIAAKQNLRHNHSPGPDITNAKNAFRRVICSFELASPESCAILDVC